MVSVAEGFETVASKATTVVPCATVWLASVSVMLRESAYKVVDHPTTTNSAKSNFNRLTYFMRFSLFFEIP